jgi:hypothetical protein
LDLLIAWYGWAHMQAGKFVYTNLRGGTALSPAVICAGMAIACIALLPPAAFVDALFPPKPTSKVIHFAFRGKRYHTPRKR